MVKDLKPKYGLFTAIAMVVGIAIGSGVFFKADDVLTASGGNLGLALLAWLIGGLIMLLGGYSFSLVASKISEVNGLVDYTEAGYGKNAGYYVGWFQTIIYYPTLTGVLAWVAGLYTVSLLGLEGNAVWYCTLIYFSTIFIMNYFAPVLAGKFQVSTTVFKLVPLVLVAVIGTVIGLSNGMTVENFKVAADGVTGGGLSAAILSTAFAYEGWVVATSLNAEIKDSKKNLPKAFIFGSLIIMVVYLTYYLGLSGTISNSVFIQEGDHAVTLAVQQLFGNFAGTMLTVFVIVSCLGTLNGLFLGTSRGMYSLAYRNRGPFPEIFSEVDDKNNVPKASTLFGGFITIVWLVVWFGNFQGWYGVERFFDTSELPIAVLYFVYILIYIWIMRTFKDLGIFKRFIIPGLALIGALVIIYGAMLKDYSFLFLMITLAVMLLGKILDGVTLKKNKTSETVVE